MVYNVPRHHQRGMAMDGLDAVYAVNRVNEVPLNSHRKEDPTWARVFMVTGWSLVWVTGLVLATLFAWKVLIPWLLHA